MATKRKDNPKHGGGTKPLPWYTPKEIVDFCASLRNGASIEIACGRARIGMTKLYERLAEKTEQSAELAKSMAEARADGASVLLAVIGKSAVEGNWQAAAKKLEWMYPDVYGRNRLELTGKDGGAVQVAAQVVLLPAPIHDADAWAKSVAADQAKMAGPQPD